MRKVAGPINLAGRPNWTPKAAEELMGTINTVTENVILVAAEMAEEQSDKAGIEVPIRCIEILQAFEEVTSHTVEEFRELLDGAEKRALHNCASPHFIRPTL